MSASQHALTPGSDLRKDDRDGSCQKRALGESEQNGVISEAKLWIFFREIPPSMVEGLVHVSSLNDDRMNTVLGRIDWWDGGVDGCINLETS